MTYDQFEEYVAEAIAKHVSRDPTVEAIDREWEDQNAARTLSRMLRVEGLRVPSPDDKVDLSEFEGR